ncbi:MAG: hypothetical protein ACRDUS_08710 [Mycobacterium sp.]
MPRIGCYYISGTGDDRESVPDQICLDQNVCIHIDGFYFGKSNARNEDLKKLLLTFPFSPYKSRTHINSGWAIEEYSWERTGEYHDVKKRSFQWAIQQMLNWDPERIHFEFAQRRPPCERDKIWKKNLLPIPAKTIHPLYYLILHYGPMLKLCSLFKEASRRGGKQGRVWAFNNFVAWMMDDFGYCIAYETALAKHALLEGDGNSRQEAQGIFHLGGKEAPEEMANKAWAAAWDMFYVRYADPSGLGKSTKYSKIAIASEDEDTPKAQSRARLVETIADTSLYISESEIELPPSEYSTDLGYGINFLSRSRPRDPKCDPYRALDDLERSLGVQHRTITGFLQSPGTAESSLLETLERLDSRP